jgi:hypothetical protein
MVHRSPRRIAIRGAAITATRLRAGGLALVGGSVLDANTALSASCRTSRERGPLRIQALVARGVRNLRPLVRAGGLVLVGWLALAAAVTLAGAGCGGSPASSATTGTAGTPATGTTADCPVDRPVLLARRADLARIAPCTALAGVVIRTAAPLQTSALRGLVTITGDLVIGPTVAVDEVTLAGLRAVDGAIRIVGNGLLRGVFLPRLEHAGRIEIDGNAVLTTISMPHLQGVRGALRITDNAQLELVEVSALTAIDGELVIERSPRLALVEAAQLRRAGSVQLELPALPADVAARLRAVAATP